MPDSGGPDFSPVLPPSMQIWASLVVFCFAIGSGIWGYIRSKNNRGRNEVDIDIKTVERLHKSVEQCQLILEQIARSNEAIWNIMADQFSEDRIEREVQSRLASELRDERSRVAAELRDQRRQRQPNRPRQITHETDRTT